jgi:hypothetical protein
LRRSRSPGAKGRTSASGALSREFRIDTMPLTWEIGSGSRISGQVYNDPSDYEALAEALPAVLD